ncbi:unnamed protein product [Mytilus coruscus]|uniref:Uncharacterized protein n=1 Tax=Mytilus coruscus TaxID=42192 RepID=A0A6J8DAX8_MYTCO|nr:unnamed protein product [Mytilus coruscus]
MLTYSFATVIIAFVVGDYGHDCSKYSLTPSDQSLVDMMKHYLHTSRKAECPVTPSQQDKSLCQNKYGIQSAFTVARTGNLFDRLEGTFIKTKEEVRTTSVYPVILKMVKHTHTVMVYYMNTEYNINSGTKPSGLSGSLFEKEIPCAVCRRKEKVSVLMIAGRKSCYKEWQSEYSGFLMSEHKTHHNKDFICIDGDAKPMDDRSSRENGALFYPVRAKCDSLRCPPYKDNTEVHCTVCIK